MSLPELEKEYIQPLTRTEKWQLIKDIQKMLQQEERAEEEGDAWFRQRNNYLYCRRSGNRV